MNISHRQKILNDLLGHKIQGLHPVLFQHTDKYFKQLGYQIQPEDYTCKVGDDTYVFPKWVLDYYLEELSNDINVKYFAEKYYSTVYSKLQKNLNLIADRLKSEPIDFLKIVRNFRTISSWDLENKISHRNFNYEVIINIKNEFHKDFKKHFVNKRQYKRTV